MRRGTIKFLLRILVLSMGLLVPTKTLGQNQKIDKGYELFKKGQVLYGKEEYEKSIKYFDSALAIGTSLKETNLIWLATFLKGNVYIFDDQNQNALEAYTESIRIAKKSKNYKRELISYSGLVLVYDKTHQYAKAVKLSDKILSSIDTTDLKDTSTHGNIITTSIEAYLDTERYDLVLKYADQGIALSKKFDNKMVLVDLYIKKGAVYYHKKQYPTSLEYLFKAEIMLQNDTIPNPFYATVNTSYFIASNNYQQGNYDAAIKRLHTNIEASKEKDLLKLPVLQSHLLLANCYGEIKNFKEALHWNDRYVALNEAFQKRKDKTVNKIYEKEATILKGSIAALKSEYLQSEKIKKYAYCDQIVTCAWWPKRQRPTPPIFPKSSTCITRKILTSISTICGSTMPCDVSKTIVCFDPFQ